MIATYAAPSTHSAIEHERECFIDMIVESLTCHGPTAEAGTKTSRPIVCLLDDDWSVLKATSRLLHSGDWNVKSFAKADAFLRYAEAHKPEVAVIDIWMPEMSGLEVQQRLKTISPSTRIIVLTSRDDVTIRARAITAGAYAFFMKGVSPKELLIAIAAATVR